MESSPFSFHLSLQTGNTHLPVVLEAADARLLDAHFPLDAQCPLSSLALHQSLISIWVGENPTCAPGARHGIPRALPHVFFFFLPSLLLPSPKKLSRFSVPSARVAILTCPREKGAPTIATEWTDLIWTQGICPWRRRETLLLRNMIARERNRPRRSGSVQLRTSSECRFPQLRCFTRQALRPVTSAPFGHTPSQPPVHLLRGPQFSRAWGTPTVESPVDLSSFSLDTPPMPKP